MKNIEIIDSNNNWKGTFRYEPSLEKCFIFVNDDNEKEIRLADLDELPENVVQMISKEQKCENIYDEFYSYPLKAQIQLNTTCNCMCKMCYASSNRVGKKIMSLEKLNTLLDKLKEIGVMQITLVGGEIFVREDIAEIFDLIEQKNLFINVITNGIIPGTRIEKFKEYLHKIYRIQISCNGYEDSYLNEYGLKDWEFAKNAITNLAREIQTQESLMSFVITEDNYNDIGRFFSFVNDIGIKKIKFGAQIFMGCSEKDKALTYFTKVVPSAIRIIEDCKKIYKNITVENQLDFQYDINDFQKNTDEYRSYNFYFSPEGKDSIYIKADGTIYPHPLFSVEEFKIGTIEDDLENLWRNSPVLNKLRLIKFEDTECYKRGCRNICGFYIRSYVYAWNKNLLGKIPCAFDNWRDMDD